MAALLLVALPAAAAPTAAPAPGPAVERILVARDIHGVAHVRARTDAGALYGAGFVAGSDRLFQMHRLRRAAQGRLAELIGLRGSGAKTTLTQDISFRTRRVYEQCQAVAANLDLTTLALLQAYCDGVNAALERRAQAGALPALLAGQVPEPWMPADCLAVWNRVAEHFGQPVPAGEPAKRHAIAQAGSCLLYADSNPSYVVVDESAAVVQPADLAPQTLQALCAFAASKGYACQGVPADGTLAQHTGPVHVTDVEYPRFSNAWVLGGAALAGGGVALVSDPKTAIHAPSIWQELHLTGASFDARGIGIPGAPGFLIGFNRHVAWGATALGIDLADTFALTTSADGTRYLHDGEWRDVERRTETILVATDTGFDEHELEVRWTHLGPVVTGLLPGVDPGEEYALRAVPLVDTDRHTVQATLALLAARRARDVVEALGHWRVPAVNVVYGDATGHVGYRMAVAVPVRSPQTCLGGVASQDGTTSATDWQGFIPPELLPGHDLPVGGAVFSANHLPVGGWYPIPLLLGTGGSGDGPRSWRLRELLADGAARLTPEQVAALRLDEVNPVRRELVRGALHLRAVFPEAFTPSAHLALDRLEGWLLAGARSSLDEPDFPLAWNLDTTFRHADWPGLVETWGGNNLVHFLKDVKARLDALAGPVAGGDGAAARRAPVTFTQEELDFFDHALTTAWDRTLVLLGGDPAQWAAKLAADVGRFVAGHHQSLEGFGSLAPAHDLLVTGLTSPDPDTLGDQAGSSYSLFARPGHPRDSRALLPVGQDEDPASPFATHEARALVERTLRGAPLHLLPGEVRSVQWLERAVGAGA